MVDSSRFAVPPAIIWIAIFVQIVILVGTVTMLPAIRQYPRLTKIGLFVSAISAAVGLVGSAFVSLDSSGFAMLGVGVGGWFLLTQAIKHRHIY